MNRDDTLTWNMKSWLPLYRLLISRGFPGARLRWAAGSTGLLPRKDPRSPSGPTMTAWTQSAFPAPKRRWSRGLWEPWSAAIWILSAIPLLLCWRMRTTAGLPKEFRRKGRKNTSYLTWSMWWKPMISQMRWSRKWPPGQQQLPTIIRCMMPGRRSWRWRKEGTIAMPERSICRRTIPGWSRSGSTLRFRRSCCRRRPWKW